MKHVARLILGIPISIAIWYLRALESLRPFVAQRMRETLNRERDNSTTDVLHTPRNREPVELTLATPNSVCQFRADSFSFKEPETLEWLEEFGGHGAFYDVGSNVGLYAIYHAKLFSNQVYAFEPSVLNLKWLVRNISLNHVTDRVVVVPTPLAASNEVAAFRLSNLTEGGALSSFGVETGHDGQQLETQMQYQMLGFSLDFLVSRGVIPDPPSTMKLDVDGIEHLILSGSMSVLKSPSLRSVLVEVNESFGEQHQGVSRSLEDCGLRLREKRHAEVFDVGEFSDTYNQIWVRE